MGASRIGAQSRTSEAPRNQRESWLRVKKSVYQRLWGGRAASETPVVLFLAGDTRLGGGQLLSILQQSLETAVYTADDPRAFADGELRGDEVLRSLIGQSRAPVMVFVLDRTPDDHALAALVERFQPARAIWLYDDYRRFVHDAAQGPTDRAARVHLDQLLKDQGEGTTESTLPADLTAVAADESLTGEAVRALYWYARHARFRDHALDRLRTVHLFSGEALRLTPRETMTRLLEAAGIGPAVLDRARLDTPRNAPGNGRHRLPVEIESACDGLLVWLDRQAGG